MKLIHIHNIPFKNAFNGIIWAFTSQPNFKIHCILSALTLLFGFILHISYIEMTILVFAIIFGLGIEMVNTSIEAMTDLITTEWKKQAKIAKDVSAGMMLLAAIGTVLVASLIFLPKLWQLFYP